MSTITNSRLVSNGVTDAEKLDAGEITSMKALLFGQMVARCQSELVSYQSDLYHDALSLTDLKFEVGATFIWGFTACHTTWATDTPEGRHLALTFNDTVYRIKITVSERGTWGVEWTLLKGDPDA